MLEYSVVVEFCEALVYLENTVITIITFAYVLTNQFKFILYFYIFNNYANVFV